MTIQALFSESDMPLVEIDELPKEGHSVGACRRVPQDAVSHVTKKLHGLGYKWHVLTDGRRTGIVYMRKADDAATGQLLLCQRLLGYE